MSIGLFFREAVVTLQKWLKVYGSTERVWTVYPDVSGTDDPGGNVSQYLPSHSGVLAVNGLPSSAGHPAPLNVIEIPWNGAAASITLKMPQAGRVMLAWANYTTGAVGTTVALSDAGGTIGTLDTATVGGGLSFIGEMAGQPIPANAVLTATPSAGGTTGTLYVAICYGSDI